MVWFIPYQLNMFCIFQISYKRLSTSRRNKTLINLKINRITASFILLLLFFFLLQRSLHKRPVDFNFLIIDFISIHSFDSSLRLLKLLVLNQRISFGKPWFTIHIKMQTFYLSVLRKSIVNVILQTLLVQTNSYDNPSFNGYN